MVTEQMDFARLEGLAKPGRRWLALAPLGGFDAGIQSTRAMGKRAESGREQKTQSGVCRLRGLILRIVSVAGVCVWLVIVAGAQAPQAESVRAVAVLDAAHGGEDMGATLATGGDEPGALVAEKAVTPALAGQLRSLLTARGFAVVMTRTGDETLDGDARATVANRAVAVACVSLHATEAGSGVHLFVSSLAPSAGALPAPWKTAQSQSVTRSLKLASELNDALAGSGNGGETGSEIPVTLGRTTLPGIDSMTCPAVVVELAPLRDAKGKIVSQPTESDYQRRVLGALAAGLLAWRDSDAGARTP